MPVVRRVVKRAERRGVEHQIVRRSPGRRPQLSQRLLQQAGQIVGLSCRHGFEMGGMVLRQNPGFVRLPARVGAHRHETASTSDHAIAGRDFGANEVAEHAPTFRGKMSPGGIEFDLHRVVDVGRRQQLAVNMLQRGAGGEAGVFENQHVPKPPVSRPVTAAVLENAEDPGQLLAYDELFDLDDVEQDGHRVVLTATTAADSAPLSNLSSGPVLLASCGG